MLNEAPNNNDIRRVANIALNKVPNSSDATCVVKNVHSTTIGAKPCSMVAKYPSCRKANLTQTRDNDTTIRKVHVDRNILCPGKEWRLYTQ